MKPSLRIEQPNNTNPIRITRAKSRLKKDVTEKKYYTIEEVAGENWRDGLDEIEDEWE
ncbi:MAG: hypothetical protein FWF94_06175 [Oscillospiraceae bacterium]|nr:hypothetical protein [Oscillospiraceae bacterium]